MTKHNLLGGRYSIPPTCPPSPPPTPTARTSPARTSSARTSASPSPKRKRTNFIASSEVLPKNNRIQTNTGFMLIEDRDPETKENIDSLSQNYLGEALGRFGKQRRMAKRLKDRIVVKTQNRKQKTNFNDFKSKFLTLKKRVSALQMEVGTEPDFLFWAMPKFRVGLPLAQPRHLQYDHKIEIIAILWSVLKVSWLANAKLFDPNPGNFQGLSHWQPLEISRPWMFSGPGNFQGVGATKPPENFQDLEITRGGLLEISRW